MQVLKSIITNCEGRYNIFGNDVFFTKKQFSVSEDKIIFADDHSANSDNSQASNKGFKLIAHIKAIAWGVLIGMPRRTNILIHELSHALAARLFTGQNSIILIPVRSLDAQMGVIGSTFTAIPDSPWKLTVFAAAGHMGGVAFNICTSALLIKLKRHIPLPVHLFLAFQGVLNMTFEYAAIFQAFMSDVGDFAFISKQGKMHLALASSLLAIQCVVGSALGLVASNQAIDKMVDWRANKY